MSIDLELVEGVRMVLSTLTCSLQSSDRGDLERQRCLRDLSIIRTRLETGEYLQSNFAERNTLSIPDRTDEIFKDLRFFQSIGAIWKELFSRAGLYPESSILDLGCGYFPKVELGLYYSAFCGEVTIADISEPALKQAHAFLDFFLVRFKVKRLCCSVWDLPRSRFDLIVGNHVLDDLLLERLASRRGISLSQAYSKESLFEELTRELVSDREIGRGLLVELVHLIKTHLKPGGKLLLLDYPSFSHRALSLHALIRYVRAMQAELRTLLRINGIGTLDLGLNRPLKRDRLTVRECHLVSGRA